VNNRLPNPIRAKSGPFRRSFVAACAAAIGVVVGGVSASAQEPAADRGAAHYDEKPAPIAGMDIVEKLGEKIPLDIGFVDSSGEKVTLGKWFNQGKPVLVMFVYYRCPLACPLLMERYGNTFREVDTLTIGKDYNVLVVSMDPTDTPETAAAAKAARMANYDRQPAKDVSAGWGYLTSPDSASTRRLADALGFPYRYIAAGNDYSHPSAAFVLAPDGKVSRYLYGIQTPAQTLRLSLVEAAEGKIGTSTDKVMLWCFHFDPKSGAYTFTAWRIMQIGGFLSAIFVAGLLVRMLMHEWRRKFDEQAKAAAAMVGGVGGMGTDRINNVSPGTGTAELAR
jgi:protein SCO1/2